MKSDKFLPLFFTITILQVQLSQITGKKVGTENFGNMEINRKKSVFKQCERIMTFL